MGRVTSVDRSDQAAVSSKNLHPLSVLVSGRPGFPPLNAIPFQTAFLRPEAEVQAGDQENPVQGRGCSRITPREFIGFRWEHVERVRAPCPGVVPLGEHHSVDLHGAFSVCYVIRQRDDGRRGLSHIFGSLLERAFVDLDDVSGLHREGYMRQVFRWELR
jgi:hypothetical protein